MLEALVPHQQISKVEYREAIPRLQRRLHQLQRACWRADLATLVVFEGWETSGKGDLIRKLTQRLEPRNFTTHVIREPRSFQKKLPWLWRFWQKLPAWGEMAIFDRSWCAQLLVERIEGSMTEQQRLRSYRDIVEFERTLADDRYQLVKFFLHISQQEQARRLNDLAADPRSLRKVGKAEWRRHRQYDQYLMATEELLARTETEAGPWTLVDASDRYWSRLEAFRVTAASMERHLVEHGVEVPEELVESETSNAKRRSGETRDQTPT